jgi:hypothetical protein
MVTHNFAAGLIATTRADVSPPLNELVDHCGWPLLVAANPRRLGRELSLHNPACVLFWLEDRHSVEATAQLVAWSRNRGARPYRVAVAFRMEAEVEEVLRAAGAHSFLPITGRSARSVADALWPLLKEPAASAAESVGSSASWKNIAEPAATVEMPSDLVRPP